MNWLGRNTRPATGRRAQSKVDGMIRRGLAAAADSSSKPGPRGTTATPREDREVDTGFNPYDTAGPETLEPHRPRSGVSGSGNPYDTASEGRPKRRSWDDAVIDTVEKR